MSAVAPALRMPSVTHWAKSSWVGGSEGLLGLRHGLHSWHGFFPA